MEYVPTGIDFKKKISFAHHCQDNKNTLRNVEDYCCWSN